MFDFAWAEPEGLAPSFRVYHDYGVRVRHTESPWIKIDAVCGQTTFQRANFMGIPVYVDDCATTEITKSKRWKRRGRPDKVRHRSMMVPSGYMMNMNGKKALVLHPSLESKLRRVKEI